MPPKSKSGRLFSLKEWLTLDDTARHLSIAFGEEVTRADVLRLAIDRRLTLSVNFVNHATVRKGKLVPLEQTKFSIYRSVGKVAKDQPLFIKRDVPHAELSNLDEGIKEALRNHDAFLSAQGIHYQGHDYLVLEDRVSNISGVWDLPMLGAEALDVEHLYQMETGGPEVTLTDLEGAFVEHGEVVCQLQEDYEENEYSAGSKASGESLKKRIRFENIPTEEAAEP
jgi:hypothetical protein